VREGGNEGKKRGRERELRNLGVCGG